MKQNLLIIEENDAVRFLLTTVLQKKYRVYSCKSCLEAANLLKKIKPEVILVDVEVGKNDNIDFLVHIKSSSLFSGIPIIGLLNNGDNQSLAVCSQKSVDYCFQKPFDPEVLVKKIEELILLPVNVYRRIEEFNVSRVQLAGNL